MFLTMFLIGALLMAAGIFLDLCHEADRVAALIERRIAECSLQGG